MRLSKELTAMRHNHSNLIRWAMLLVAGLAVVPAVGQEALQLRAGSARRDITPKESVPMWGYASRRDAPSTGVRDPLYCDALVIEAGGTRLAIVGLDLGRSPGEPSLERIKAEVKAKTGMEHVLLAGSHTHHAPIMELSDEEGKGRGKFDASLRYYRELERAIAGAIGEAAEKMAPAVAAAGSVRLEGFNRNRHSKLEPKPVDRELAVLRVDTVDGKPLAALVNFAAHPTMLPDSLMEYSADYPGALKRVVAEETGAAAVFIQGAAGDLSTDGRGRDYVRYGEELGAEAVKLYRSLTPAAAAASLKVAAERFTFKPRVDLANPFVFTMYAQAFFPELVRNFRDDYEGGVKPRLSVAVLNGEIGFVAVSGELFSNHANRLRERARLKTLFFLGYCDGYHQYFPTIEGVSEGGYGADAQMAPAEVGAGERMMDRALTLLYELRGKIR